MNNFLEEKEKLLNGIENNTAGHWKEYYKNVPLDCIFEDLVIDINEIKRLTKENQKLKEEIEKIIAVADTNSELADKFYNKIQKSKEMQREFIDWLENEKKEQFIQHRICHQSYQLFIEKIIETETMILEKYKEIIGDKDEGNKKL